MSIKDTIGAMTPDALDRWVADRTQFDEWYAALVPSGTVVVARLGLAVISQGLGNGPAIEIHGHDDETQAHECYNNGIQLVAKYAIITFPGVSNSDDQPTVELGRPALPVSTDEPTARGFGWL